MSTPTRETPSACSTCRTKPRPAGGVGSLALVRGALARPGSLDGFANQVKELLQSRVRIVQAVGESHLKGPGLAVDLA